MFSKIPASMALLLRLPLLLLLLLLPLALPTASASHHHSPAGRHHRPDAALLYSDGPSIYHNKLPVDEKTGLPEFAHSHRFDDAAEAPSGEADIAAMGAAATAASPAQVVAPAPLLAAPDLSSMAPPPQAEAGAEGSVSWAAAPPVEEPAAATTTTLPLPAAASPPPPPVQVVSGDEQRLQQLARVLTSLGYNEMASAAPLLTGLAGLARWTGPITVFAAPDVFLHASCPMCSRSHLLLEHIALGYFPYPDLTAFPAARIPSASAGYCLNLAAERGPFDNHHAKLYVDGVEVSHPELYDDGRYVVHGLHGFLRPLSRTSCFEGGAHLLTPRSSAATSAATAASVTRIMIREAMARLRDGGYGFLALAMRVKFAELERLANMTVFALDDQAIFAGGGHDYVTAVRFHIVPGRRLTNDDLLRLHPGTVLPTLAGEGQKLVVTQGAKDVRINYIPIKDPDVVINSRVAVHGVYVPFPHLHLADLAALVAATSSMTTNGTSPQ